MDKVLLITGASSEVGMELLNHIYEDYSHIYLQYRVMNDELNKCVEKICNKVKISLIQADLLECGSAEKMIESIKETGILPNHFIHLPYAKISTNHFQKDTWEHFESDWNIAVRTAVLVSNAFIKNMMKQKYGRIIFLLSASVGENPPKYLASYVTVKTALLGLMRALAAEYAEKGITVNGVSPEMMETKFLTEYPDIVVEQNRENSPIGRNVLVSEIIPIMMYMLSDAGAAMTGENVFITGGRH